jgi:hypothetical protein
MLFLAVPWQSSKGPDIKMRLGCQSIQRSDDPHTESKAGLTYFL